jgi:dephospho-CoA kinase
MIIGITGYAGAGKGVVVEYLVAKHGFKHFSIRDFLTAEIERRGLPVTREMLGQVGDELRKEHGPLAKLMLKDVAADDDIILESIRSLMEARYIKEHGGRIWAVDADIATRFKRIQERGSVVDNVSFEQFTAVEKSESANPEPHKMNMIAVAAMADVVLRNDGTREELYSQIEEALTV